jgi:hypothetical protein
LRKPQQPGGIYSLEDCDRNGAVAFMYLFKEKILTEVDAYTPTAAIAPLGQPLIVVR